MIYTYNTTYDLIANNISMYLYELQRTQSDPQSLLTEVEHLIELHNPSTAHPHPLPPLRH